MTTEKIPTILVKDSADPMIGAAQFPVKTEFKVVNADGYVSTAASIGNTLKTRFLTKFFPTEFFEQLYACSSIAARIVDIVAMDMVREGWSYTQDPDGSINKALTKRGFLEVLYQALICERIQGGAIIYMVIEDGRDAIEPVDINNIKNIDFRLFEARQINNFDRYTDPTLAEFDKPEYFEIMPLNGTPFFAHETRCLMFTGKYVTKTLKPYLVQTGNKYLFGMSVLQPLAEQLSGYGLSMQAILQVLAKCNVNVLKMKDLLEQISNEDGKKNIDAYTKLLNGQISTGNLLIIGEEDEYTNVPQNLSGVPETVEKLQEDIAGPTGIPVSMLYGAQKKGLGNGGDNETRLYYDQVGFMQELKLTTPLGRVGLYASKLEEVKIKKGNDQELTVEFPPLWQMTEKEEAEVRKLQSETDEKYIANGVLAPEEVRASRFGGDKYSTDTILIAGAEPVDPNDPDLAEEKETPSTSEE